MRPLRDEAGFTLIELLVVVGMIAVVVATVGTFFLAGPSPAVASAVRDVDAAFHEARSTAVAFSEATLVFTPSASGYTARVYRQVPGDPAFAAVNGPTYESTVTLAETAAPLGSPGFAFRIDSRGSVTGYQNFEPDDTIFTQRSCPLGGAFRLSFAYGKQKQTVTVPCTISLTALTPGIAIPPAAAITPAPYVPGTCPPAQNCTATLPPFTATCPPGYTPDTTQPNVCNTPTPAPTFTPTPDPPTAPPPTPTPTSSSTPGNLPTPGCSSGYQYLPPNCKAEVVEIQSWSALSGPTQQDLNVISESQFAVLIDGSVVSPPAAGTYVWSCANPTDGMLHLNFNGSAWPGLIHAQFDGNVIGSGILDFSELYAMATDTGSGTGRVDGVDTYCP